MNPSLRLAIVATFAAGTALAQTPAPGGGLFGGRSHFTEPTGSEVYRYVCAECHMADGKGAVGAGRYPALAGNAALAGAAYPIGIVLRGSRAMPPFAGALSDRQIADVVNFIRTNLGNSFPTDATPDEVRQAR